MKIVFWGIQQPACSQNSPTKLVVGSFCAQSTVPPLRTSLSRNNTRYSNNMHLERNFWWSFLRILGLLGRLYTVVRISFCRTLQFWWGKSTKALKENASFSCIPGLKTVVVTLKISEVYSGSKFFFLEGRKLLLNPQFHLYLPRCHWNLRNKIKDNWKLKLLQKTFEGSIYPSLEYNPLKR